MKYLLDTNICIELIRQRPKKLIERVTDCEPGMIGISTITVAELSYGAQKSAKVEQNISALEQFLLPLEIVEFDQNASMVYGFVRAVLEREGCTIGSMDLLIGAHALSLDMVLVTNNIGEFQRIPKLKVEDWLA
jgi:tRNA(fMet)-specific endonuclease VapC